MSTNRSLRALEGVEADIGEMKQPRGLLQPVKAWSKVPMMRREAGSDPRPEVRGGVELSGCQRIEASARRGETTTLLSPEQTPNVGLGFQSPAFRGVMWNRKQNNLRSRRAFWEGREQWFAAEVR